MMFSVHPSPCRHRRGLFPGLTRARRAGVWLAGACLLAGAGCTSDYGPHPMPSGYAFHAETFKAPPGPEPVYKNWDHYPVTGVTAVAPVYTEGVAAAYPPRAAAAVPPELRPPPMAMPMGAMNPPAAPPPPILPVAAAPIAPPPMPAADGPLSPMPAFPSSFSASSSFASPSPASSSGVTVDMSVLDGGFAAAAPAMPSLSAAPGVPGGQWDQAAGDLVQRLFSAAGKPRGAVYLEAASGASAANGQYGAVLRDMMGRLGIGIASTPGNHTLRYSASAPGPDGRALLTLTLVSGRQVVAEEAGVYSVPAPGGGSSRGGPMPLMR